MPTEPSAKPQPLDGLQDVSPEVEVTPKDDTLAKSEEKLFGEAARIEDLQKHLHRVKVVFIWGVSIGALVVLVIRLLHYVLPQNYTWMTPDQLQGLDKTFTGAIIGAIATQSKRLLPQAASKRRGSN